MDYFDTGFCVRQPSWHGKEVLLDEAPESWDEARTAAKLTWEPEARPSYITRYQKEFVLCRECDARRGKRHDAECTFDGEVLLPDCAPEGTLFATDGEHVFVPSDHQQILRNDTYALLTGDVSADYSLIYHGKKHAQGHQGFSMEQIIDMYVPLGVKFDTTGSAKGGGLVWAVMYLDEPFTVPGDSSVSVPYMTILNAHDASGACKLVFTQVRVVCANTWQMASVMGDQTGHQIVFRHVGNVEDRAELMLQSIADLREETKQYLAMAAVMQEVEAGERQIKKFLSEFIPNPAENGEQVSDRVQQNIESARAAYTHILSNSPTCEGIEGTMYGVVQAGIEYLDHSRKYRSKDTYMGRTILKADPLKARTMGIAASIFHDGLVKVKDPWAEQLIQVGEQEKARSLAARPMAIQR